jgi:hypothetical protein
MSNPHVARIQRKFPCFLRFAANIKKNTLDTVGKRATIVVYEEYQVKEGGEQIQNCIVRKKIQMRRGARA